jgi:ABC-type branched-subunit amino acid transport system ATPase component
MLGMFPNLANRADTAAGVLSGGEKQMLTICRTLMGDPELVMIDEPTEGLAPLIVQQVGDLIAEIARRGVAILLVEQKLSIAMRISHRSMSCAMAGCCSKARPPSSRPMTPCARNGWRCAHPMRPSKTARSCPGKS